MAYKEINVGGKRVTQEIDSVTGLLTQAPDGGVPALIYSATQLAGIPAYGIPFVIRVAVSGAGPNFPIFTDNAPFDFEIVLAWAYATAANGAADTWRLETAPNAGAFSAASNNQDANVAANVLSGLVAGTSTLVRNSGYTGLIVKETESLRVVTTSSPSLAVYIMGIRVNP